MEMRFAFFIFRKYFVNVFVREEIKSWLDLNSFKIFIYR